MQVAGGERLGAFWTVQNESKMAVEFMICMIFAGGGTARTARTERRDGFGGGQKMEH